MQEKAEKIKALGKRMGLGKIIKQCSIYFAYSNLV